MFCASPKWQEVVQGPQEFVARVCVNGLEETEDDPAVHGEDVEILGECTPDDWHTDRSETKNHDFDRRRIFSSKTERRRVLVVNLVDHLVQRTPVECAVRPVMPAVFDDEENRDLVGHLV